MPPQPPQDQTGKKDPLGRSPTGEALDPKSFLLPKKETGPSLDSAERAPAGELVKQEQKAAQVGSTEVPASGYGDLSADKSPEVGSPSLAKPPLADTPVTPSIGELSAPASIPGAGPQPPKDEPMVRPIETYGSDINRAVVQGNISEVTIAAAEAERRSRGAHGEPQSPGILSRVEPPSPRNIALIIAGSILVVGALGAAGMALLLTRPVAPVQTASGPASLVGVDQVVDVPASNDRLSLMQSLNDARLKVSLPLGLVARLYVTVPTTTGAEPEQLPAAQLVGTLAPTAPDELLRTLLPEYVLGVHSFDENQAFLLLQVDSYQQGYSGMLAWEETMQNDLLPLFARTPPQHLEASHAATSSPASQFIQTGFVDQVVDNHNARVLTNGEGDILLLWTFLDRSRIVIATNEYTLSEVIGRLNAAPVVAQPH